MADLQRLIRSIAPDYALRNARREVVEHARVQAEVDALIQRLSFPVAQSAQSLDRSRRAS